LAETVGSVTGRIVTPSGILEDGTVRLDGDRILTVGRARRGARGALALEMPGCLVYPGWINLHVHGALGADFTDPDPEAPAAIARYLAGQGWAAYLATYLSSPLDALSRALAHVGADPSGCGAEAIGVHLEGPFLNPRRRGSHPREALVAPSVALLSRLLDCVPAGLKAMVTLAPELPGAAELIAALRARGAIPALGHSAATYDECRQAIAAGMRHAVHLFNASGPLHHREPGAPGAFLTSHETTCEVIPDLVHLHPAVLELILAARGADGAVVVTDSIAPTGLGDGEWRWAGRTVHVSGARACLDDGTVAGSVLETPRMLEVLRGAGVAPERLARLLSAHPARALGLAHERGAIEPGKRADLTVVSPEDRPVLTIAGGRAVWRAQRAKRAGVAPAMRVRCAASEWTGGGRTGA
jgi:N-acetylglucosamine-6-phosphate deacetylase